MTKETNDKEFWPLVEQIKHLDHHWRLLRERQSLIRALRFAAAWASVGWALAAWGWLR